MKVTADQNIANKILEVSTSSISTVTQSNQSLTKKPQIDDSDRIHPWPVCNLLTVDSYLQQSYLYPLNHLSHLNWKIYKSSINEVHHMKPKINHSQYSHVDS